MVGLPSVSKRNKKARIFMADGQAAAPSAPWSLADAKCTWPLQPQHVGNVLALVGQGKQASVISELRQRGHIKLATSLNKKWRPQDALSCVIQDELNETVTADTESPTFDLGVRRCQANPQVLERSCWQKHPGLCKHECWDDSLYDRLLRFGDGLRNMIMPEARADQQCLVFESAIWWIPLYLADGTLLSGSERAVFCLP